MTSYPSSENVIRVDKLTMVSDAMLVTTRRRCIRGMMWRTLSRANMSGGDTCGMFCSSTNYSAVLKGWMPFSFVKFVGNIIIAGGSALSRIEHDSNTNWYGKEFLKTMAHNAFKASDIDIYIRAADQQEANKTLKFIMSILMPCGIVSRTPYAITLEVPYHRLIQENVHQYNNISCHEDGPIYKVQIIDRLLPKTDDITKDLSGLLSSFDLDCCKWATDGEHVYATESAIRCLQSRICVIPWAKITDSLLSRMAKYFRRCYDFEIEGYVGDSTEFTSAAKRALEMTASMKIGDSTASNYDATGDQCGRQDDLMFRMFKNFGVTKSEPRTICCYASETEQVWEMIGNGTQPVEYLFDWGMTVMNKMSENIMWMACSSEKDRDDMRGMCVKSIGEWKGIMSTIKLPPMFANTNQKFIGLSAEVYERFWKPQRVERDILILD